MNNNKNPCAYVIPCRGEREKIVPKKLVRGKGAIFHDSLPRDVQYSFMPPAYYAKGYRILPAYKIEFDLTEMKKLLFLEDPELVHKWGALRERIPYPENRVVDLPGTREIHYKNYYLRSLTPESAMSWRKSIAAPLQKRMNKDTENEYGPCMNRAPKPACNNKNCPYK